MSETPLIYTAKGNIPTDELDLKVTWEDNLTLEAKLQDDGEGNMMVAITKGGDITMIEEYFDKQTGECVKRSAHVHLFQGFGAAIEAGEIGQT